MGLYLIAIKSRGEATFDIAERMTCPECKGMHLDQISEQGFECSECDEGFWWITTAGHRAHPFRTWDMDDIYDGSDYDAPKPMSMLDTMPEDAIDLYQLRAAKIITSSGKSLLVALGLIPKIVRRL